MRKAIRQGCDCAGCSVVAADRRARSRDTIRDAKIAHAVPLLEKSQEFGGRSERSCIAMIVESVVAHSVSFPSFSANTSAVHTFSVLPERTTRARATSSSPAAGATRLILYSTVRTE